MDNYQAFRLARVIMPGQVTPVIPSPDVVMHSIPKKITALPNQMARVPSAPSVDDNSAVEMDFNNFPKIRGI